MSNINTNLINTTYPLPGVNNSTQGFRDNFSSIKTNLDTAKTEITDLQNKTIVKATLDGGVLDNNMNNTLISNALTKGFRGTTVPIAAGNIPPATTLNVNNGDYQYGIISENTTLGFTGWSPSGTYSNVVVTLTFANTNAVVYLPNTTFNSSAQPISGMRNSVRTLENYASNANPTANAVAVNQLSIPSGVSEVTYKFSSTDCGTTIDVEPLNRNRVTSQAQLRVPTSYGLPGDRAGTVATYNGVWYTCIDTYGANATFATSSVAGTGSTCTIYFPSQTCVPYKVGSTIVVSGVTPSQYNGTFTVSAVAQNYVSYAHTATGVQTVSGTVTGPKIIWTYRVMDAVI